MSKSKHQQTLSVLAKASTHPEFSIRQNLPVENSTPPNGRPFQEGSEAGFWRGLQAGSQAGSQVDSQR